ncbi:hypothetical protein AB0758_17830 [Tolypothrix bouteillei VB521301_2]|uniref:Uncharacterized protein n=1 Tax=Tolypothrix bouteillei VB521301 TaxID=1479485 RepID=A0A8S9T155_9CYAN|nr:hypothetical protein DA73_0400006890 [Tolypothrix bouteillei VB521301]
MNRILLTSLVFVFLLLLITAPFAALASLMLFLLASAFLMFIWNIFSAIIGDS